MKHAEARAIRLLLSQVLAPEYTVTQTPTPGMQAMVKIWHNDASKDREVRSIEEAVLALHEIKGFPVPMSARI